MFLFLILSLKAYEILSPVPLTDFDNVTVKHDLSSIKIIDGKREITVPQTEASNLKSIVETLKNYRQPPVNISSIINDFVEEDPLDIDEIIALGKTSFLVVFSDVPVDNVDFVVYWSTDRELAMTLGVEYPGIYGYNAVEKHHFKLSISNVSQAVAIVTTPFLKEITVENLRTYDNTQLPKLFIFYSKPLEHDKYRAVAKKYADRVKIGTILFTEETSLKNFGIDEHELPAVIVIHEKKKFKCEMLDCEKLSLFIEQLLSNTITEYRMSGVEPEDNDTRKVKVLTSTNLDKYKDKDLLVVFSSPHCRFCTMLKPIIDELGNKVKHPDVVIGDYNVGENDVSNKFDIKGYPTVILISDGKNVVFDEERKVEKFVEFIEKNGRYKDITSEQSRDDL